MVNKIWASRPSPAIRRHRAKQPDCTRVRGRIKIDALRAFVETMTNHERSLWGRQKCPGLRERDAERVGKWLAGVRG